MACFRLKMTGIVTLVAGNPEEGWANPGTVSVVLPNLAPPGSVWGSELRTTPDHRLTKDGHEHFGFLRIPSVGEGSPPTGGAGKQPGQEELIYLHGHTLEFQHALEGNGVETLYDESLRGNVGGSEVPTESLDNLAWVPHLTDFVGEKALRDDLFSSGNDQVLALGELRGGRLRAQPVSTAIQWEWRQWDTGKWFLTPLTDSVYWELDGADSVDIVLRSRETGAEVMRRTIPVRSEDVEVHLHNLCRGNPLGWEVTGEPTDDKDFLWHFTLLEGVEGQGRLPYPLVWVHPGASAEAGKCSPSMWP